VAASLDQAEAAEAPPEPAAVEELVVAAVVAPLLVVAAVAPLLVVAAVAARQIPGEFARFRSAKVSIICLYSARS
jgi:hypothetical protein